LHTVVGTTAPGSAEGINTLPAVVGATLAGIDKSNQNGLNYDNQAALLAVPPTCPPFSLAEGGI